MRSTLSLVIASSAIIGIALSGMSTSRRSRGTFVPSLRRSISSISAVGVSPIPSSPAISEYQRLARASSELNLITSVITKLFESPCGTWKNPPSG